jgi:hypothetical protein
MFRTVPLSIIRSFLLYTQQWYMSYRFADSQLDALISQIYFWNETLHVSDSSSVHHQEFFTVHTAMVYVIQICWQPTRCTNFSNLFLEWNSTCFGQFLCPSSGGFHCTHSNGMSYRFADSLRARSGCSILILLDSCQQICMTYTIAVCTVKNSCWWTEELSGTFRVLFQE